MCLFEIKTWPFPPTGLHKHKATCHRSSSSNRNGKSSTIPSIEQPNVSFMCFCNLSNGLFSTTRFYKHKATCHQSDSSNSNAKQILVIKAAAALANEKNKQLQLLHIQNCVSWAFKFKWCALQPTGCHKHKATCHQSSSSNSNGKSQTIAII